MVIALKVLLFVLMAACGLTIRFLYREFKGVVSSTEYDESSILDKFVIYLMAIGSGILLLSVMLFSGLLLFCEITVGLPW